MGLLVIGILTIVADFIIDSLITKHKMSKSGKTEEEVDTGEIPVILAIVGAVLSLVMAGLIFCSLVHNNTNKIILTEQYKLIEQRLENGICRDDRCVLDEIYYYNTKILVGQQRNNNILTMWATCDYTDFSVFEYSAVDAENHREHTRAIEVK